MRAVINTLVIVALAVLVIVVVGGIFIFYSGSFKHSTKKQATAAECDKYCSLEQQWWAQTTESKHSNSKWCIASCWKTSSCTVLYSGKEHQLRCQGNDAVLNVDCSWVDCSQYEGRKQGTNICYRCWGIPYYQNLRTCWETYPSSVDYCECCCEGYDCGMT